MSLIINCPTSLLPPLALDGWLCLWGAFMFPVSVPACCSPRPCPHSLLPEPHSWLSRVSSASMVLVAGSSLLFLCFLVEIGCFCPCFNCNSILFQAMVCITGSLISKPSGRLLTPLLSPCPLDLWIFLYLSWHWLLLFNVIPALLLLCLYLTDAFQSQLRRPEGIRKSVLRREMPQAAVRHGCWPWGKADCSLLWCPLKREWHPVTSASRTDRCFLILFYRSDPC